MSKGFWVGESNLLDGMKVGPSPSGREKELKIQRSTKRDPYDPDSLFVKPMMPDVSYPWVSWFEKLP